MNITHKKKEAGSFTRMYHTYKGKEHLLNVAFDFLHAKWSIAEPGVKIVDSGNIDQTEWPDEFVKRILGKAAGFIEEGYV